MSLYFHALPQGKHVKGKTHPHDCFINFLLCQFPHYRTAFLLHPIASKNLNLVCYFMEMEIFQGKHLSPNIETIYLSPSCTVANTCVLQ